MLIDIGVNLTGSAFRHDLDEVIARARDAGVGVMIVTGTDEAHSRAALELVGRYPKVLYATAGVHPHHAAEWSDRTLKGLEALAGRPGVVALGECGLDFNRDYSPRDLQEKAFEAQLELAVSARLPVFLHQRDAHDRFVAILSRYRDRLVDAVAHCFTGTADELAACLDMDLHIGITGWICDERRGLHLQRLVNGIPLHRLMLETDAPYLLPRTLDPRPATRRNEPMYLPHICETVARCRGMDAAALAAATTRTAQTFFRLPVQ